MNPREETPPRPIDAAVRFATRGAAMRLSLAYALVGTACIFGFAWLHSLNRKADFQDNLPLFGFVGLSAVILWLVLNYYFRTLRGAARLLAKSEERGKRALEGAAQAVWDWDLATGVVYYSPEWKKLVGHEDHEIGANRMEWESRVHPEDLPEALRLLTAHLENASPAYASEHRLRGKDGVFRWVSEQGKVTDRSSTGRPLRLVGTTTDIQPRRQAEARERVQLELMRALTLVENRDAGLALCLAAATRIEGLDGGAIYLIDPVSGAFDLAVHHGFSQGFPRAAARLAAGSAEFACITSEKPACVARQELRREQHGVFAQEGFRSVAFFPLTEQGRVAGCLVVGARERDELAESDRLLLETLAATTLQLIARLRAQERLSDSEANYRTFFQTVDDLILVASLDGRLLFGNAAVARKLGYDEAALSNLTVADLHPPEMRAEAATILAGMLRGEANVCPLPLLRKDGSHLPVETRVWFGDWDGRRCLFGICKDVSAEREARARFEGLFRKNPLPMALAELADLRFSDVNEAFVEVFGYAAEEVLGRRVSELRWFPDEETEATVSHRLLEAGEIRQTELQLRAKDGTTRTVLFNGEVVMNEGKRYFLMVVMDVTDRKRAEAEILRQETRLRLALEAAEMITWELDVASGRIVYSSNISIVAGSDDIERYQTLPSFVDQIHPDDRERLAAAITRTIEGGEAFACEYRVRLPDGAWHWLAGRGRPTANAEGRSTQVIGVSIDITHRKNAEEALAAEATRRRMFVEGSRDGIVVLDKTGGVVEANPRFANSLGYTLDEIRTMHVSDWDSAWSRERVTEAIRALGPEGAHFETRHHRKDGSSFDVELSNSVAELGGQKLVFCVCHDITQRKQTEAALQQSLLFRREAERIGRIGAWKASPASDFLHWTEGVYDLLDAPVENRPGLRDGLKYYDAESIPRLQAALEAALRHGTPFSLEAGLTTRRGRHIWVEVRGFGRVEEDGQAYVVGTIQDISGRKEQETYTRLHLQMLQSLAADEPLPTVLDSIVRLLECRHEDWIGSIMLVTEDHAHLRCGAAPRLPPSFARRIALVPIGECVGSCGAAVATKRPVIVENISTHPNWREYSEAAEAAELRAAWSLPIQSAQGEVWGALAVYRDKPVLPTADDLRAMEDVVNLARVAIRKLKAEEALREREEIFSSIVAQAADSIVIFDGESGRLVEFNTAAHEGLGYTREEFAGLTVQEIAAETPWPAATAVRADGGARFETRHRHRAGHSRDARVRLQPLHISEHDYIAALWTDVTERKQARARAERDKLQTGFLLDLHQRAPQMSDADLYDHVVDRAVRLTDSTIGFFHLVSDDQRDVILTTWNAEAKKHCSAPASGHYPLAQAGNWVECVREKRPVVYNDFPASPNQRGLPEGHVPLRRIMGVPVVRDGKVQIIFGVGNKASDYDDEDVAQLQLIANELHKLMTQRSAQEQLRESEERFRHLVETSNDWIWETDAEARYVYASPRVSALLGYAPEAVIGRTPFDFMPEPEAVRVREVFADLKRRRRPFLALENLYRHRDGRDVTVESSGAPVFAADGKLLGYRGIDRDVSERRRLELQLRQAQKLEAIGQLAGGVAHDFNNILAATMMHLGMLRMNQNLDDRTRLALQELDKGAQRAATLTRQLLMFSRRSILCVQPLDLNDVVTNLLKMLGRLIGEHIELRFDPAGGLPLVSADAGMMEQVVMNLVVNARDAMPRGGRITIATALADLSEQDRTTNTDRRVGRFVCLQVADTGCGMSDDTLKRIFEPFFTTKEIGKGTGLGLATVHGIAAQHHGWVEVESGLGRGSVFRIFMPGLVAAAPPSPAPAERNAPLRSGRERILVVEDDETLRAMVVESLRTMGYRVHHAPHGPAGVARWNELSGGIDLLFTDMVMPEGVNGLDLAKRLREQNPRLPVIISSGYSAEIVEAGVPVQEGIHYLPKPFSIAALSELVRRVLDGA